MNENQDETIEGRMDEIRGRIELMEAGLPARVDALSISPRAKVPFKVEEFRTALIWRFAELARGAYENFRRDHLAVAILITRGAIETAAACWYLYRRVDETIKANALGDLDGDVMKLLLGGRTNPDMPQAINVLTFIKRFDKEGEGDRLEKQYAELSEFAHPNWAGTLGLFGKTNTAEFWTDFARGIRDLDAPRMAGTIALSIALLIFEHGYNRLADLMEPLIELCEVDLDKQK